MHIQRIRSLLACALFASCTSGCVPIPLALPEGEPFEEVVEEFLEVGETSSEEVRGELGEPRLEEGDWWLYQATRRGWQWGFCAAAYYSASCGSLPRSIHDSFLAVEFDETARVSNVALYSGDELCDDRQICFDSHLLMRAADDAGDVLAKQFQAPADGCAVYTWSDTNSSGAAGELLIDGRKVGDVVGKRGFHAHSVGPGPHAIMVMPRFNVDLPMFLAMRKFECSGGEVAFLRYSMGAWRNKLEQAKPAEGEEAVRERWLAQPADETATEITTNWLRDHEVFVVRGNNRISAYQLNEQEKIPRWGQLDSSEPCGMRAVLEHYGMAPLGAHTGLHFGESLSSVVELQGLCSRDGDCTFASVIDGESCEAVPDREISFSLDAKLLILEPAGDSVREIFFGKGRAFKKYADCRNRVCAISEAALRDAVAKIR